MDFSVYLIKVWCLNDGAMKKPLKLAILAIIIVIILSVSLFFFLESKGKPNPSSNVTYYTYNIVNSYPHDPTAFTEGLTYSDGYLYESTGEYGQSSLRRVDLTTGDVLQQINLPSDIFGEGMTIVNDTIFQLTYQSNHWARDQFPSM